MFTFSDDQLRFTLCGDDNTVIYVDGVKVTTKTIGQSVTVNLSPSVRLLAVAISNTDEIGGMNGAFSDGRVTDSLWKCIDQYSAGWETLTFDDSDWSQPNTQRLPVGLLGHTYAWNQVAVGW